MGMGSLASIHNCAQLLGLILRLDQSFTHSFTVFSPTQFYFRDKYKIIDIRKLCQKNGLVVSSEEHQSDHSCAFDPEIKASQLLCIEAITLSLPCRDVR